MTPTRAASELVFYQIKTDNNPKTLDYSQLGHSSARISGTTETGSFSLTTKDGEITLYIVKYNPNELHHDSITNYPITDPTFPEQVTKQIKAVLG